MNVEDRLIIRYFVIAFIIPVHTKSELIKLKQNQNLGKASINHVKENS